METVEMADSPYQQSQCFSLACLLTHAHTYCTHMHTAAWITTVRSQTPGETIINDELCDPVSVQRKLTFPLIPRDILLTSHLSFTESWLIHDVLGVSDPIEWKAIKLERDFLFFVFLGGLSVDMRGGRHIWMLEWGIFYLAKYLHELNQCTGWFLFLFFLRWSWIVLPLIFVLVPRSLSVTALVSLRGLIKSVG